MSQELVKIKMPHAYNITDIYVQLFFLAFIFRLVGKLRILYLKEFPPTQTVILSKIVIKFGGIEIK